MIIEVAGKHNGVSRGDRHRLSRAHSGSRFTVEYKLAAYADLLSKLLCIGGVLEQVVSVHNMTDGQTS
jgi:hypothetical protein